MSTLLKSGIAAAAGVALTLVITTVWPPAGTNPDANHAHADFAVWTHGKQFDFSDAKYMMTEDEEQAAPANSPKKYFHLHDGNGHVIHRHKPGRPLSDFFSSIGFGVASEKQGEWCWFTLSKKHPFSACESGPMHVYVNGNMWPGNPFDYVFQDNDQLLLTDASTDTEVRHELSLMTHDACLYSETCPWRGKAPTESCVSDPTVPCKE